MRDRKNVCILSLTLLKPPFSTAIILAAVTLDDCYRFGKRCENEKIKKRLSDPITNTIYLYINTTLFRDKYTRKMHMPTNTIFEFV